MNGTVSRLPLVEGKFVQPTKLYRDTGYECPRGQGRQTATRPYWEAVSKTLRRWAPARLCRLRAASLAPFGLRSDAFKCASSLAARRRTASQRAFLGTHVPHFERKVKSGLFLPLNRTALLTYFFTFCSCSLNLFTLRSLELWFLEEKR